MLKTFAMLIAGATVMSLSAYCQEETYRSEVSAHAIGSFVKSTVQDGVTQSATDSGGVLANYRFFVNKNHGVEVNYGYTLNTQRYGSGSNLLGIKSYSHEATAAYVLRFPLRRWSPFVLAGGGGLTFDPKDVAGANTQGRVAFLYGAGADISLTRRLFMRAEYRGLVYNSPTFDVVGLSGMDRVTHRAEPSLGFGFRF